MSRSQILAALKVGILTKSQADSLLIENSGDPAEAVTPAPSPIQTATIGNEEDLRFIRGFSDVFIAMGVGLLALGLLAALAPLGPLAGTVIAVIVMSVLADYFGRKKRAHLPTLICALAFLFFIGIAIRSLLEQIGVNSEILASVLSLVAMGLFYARIRLPFCIALIAISGLSLAYSLLSAAAPLLTDGSIGLFLILGGGVTFAGALYYDTKDIHRTTRFSDNAFWLHLLAAPLLIHGVALQMITAKAEKILYVLPVMTFETTEAIFVLVFIGLIALMALAINRRALIGSSLGYAALAIGFLTKTAGLGFGTSLTVTLLILGSLIIFLSVAWHPARNLFIKVLPNWRIFPPPYNPDYKP